jgi:hypothetical protein
MPISRVCFCFILPLLLLLLYFSMHDALILCSVRHGGERPAGSYALLFTRDEKGIGEKRVINMVTISNNDNFKNINNKPSIIGRANMDRIFRNYIKKKHMPVCLANFAI